MSVKKQDEHVKESILESEVAVVETAALVNPLRALLVETLDLFDAVVGGDATRPMMTQDLQKAHDARARVREIRASLIEGAP